MKNKEYYRNQIGCYDRVCNFVQELGDCTYNEYEKCRNCYGRNLLTFSMWLDDEYIGVEEKPKLTKQERAFVDCLGSDWGSKVYIARDKNNDLHIYHNKLCKGYNAWMMVEEELNCMYFKINNNLFPFIKWENDEPWSIKDLKALEVVE